MIRIKLMIVLILLLSVRLNLSDDVTDSTTENLSSMFEVFERSDLPQAEVDDALILEVGTYTTMRFRYFNAQVAPFEDPYDPEWKAHGFRCTNDYVKCIINQDNPTPVCGYNRNFPRWEDQGVRTFDSYCDLYYANCRIGYRHWRTIDTGRCVITDDYNYVISYPDTFRRAFKKWFRYLGLDKVRKFLHL